MKKNQLSRNEIKAILREYDEGRVPSVVALCEKYGISRQAFYNWRAKYGAEDDAQTRLQRLERETRQLRRALEQQSVAMRALQQRLAPELLAPVEIVRAELHIAA